MRVRRKELEKEKNEIYAPPPGSEGEGRGESGDSRQASCSIWGIDGLLESAKDPSHFFRKIIRTYVRTIHV